MTKKCVMCGKDIPEKHKQEDTCCDVCAYNKMVAIIEFQRDHKEAWIPLAIEVWKDRHGKR